MKRAYFVLSILLLLSCNRVRPVYQIPDISLNEAAFFPTIEAHTDAPIISGNRIDILLNGNETFPLMLAEIRKAKRTITFAQYLYEDGQIAYDFAKAFAERCRAGVQANILLDSHGTNTPDEIPDMMRQAGCNVHYFRRVEAPQVVFIWKLFRYNYRNHRRSLVIDGRIGFTGGYGIKDTWLGDGRTEGRWRETNARLEGPIVKYLQASFTESWLEATGALLGGDGYFPRLEARGKLPAQIVKSSPVGGSFQNYMLFLLSITSAKKSILITNPYFIPDDRMIDALLNAAGRGVQVIVLVPGKIDHKITYRASRSSYGRMLLGGIQIYEYLPALMHAKTMVVDGVWATIGSTNFDNRSFGLNEELNLTVYDRGVAGRLHKIFYEDLKHSKKITYEDWRARGFKEKFFELFAYPIRDLL
ncbi:MAG TPA: phospholipase D-like domain-containing protein [Candidatus Binatia bacterium]|nr:phospholipase D-like domain-containing protein [Candidatus Binatia bacterium]